jgi:hypothetical protein
MNFKLMQFAKVPSLFKETEICERAYRAAAESTGSTIFAPADRLANSSLGLAR